MPEDGIGDDLTNLSFVYGAWAMLGVDVAEYPYFRPESGLLCNLSLNDDVF